MSMVTPQIGQDHFAVARRRLPRGLVLAQRLAGCGAFETSASGATVTLSDGTTVLDFSSYAVTLFGHRPPRVVNAVKACLDQMPTSTRTLSNPLTVAAAEFVAQRVDPERLPRVWMATSGSDVVEAVLKLARVASGRSTIAAVKGGFHGKTLGALTATHNQRYREPFASILPETVFLEPEPDALAAACARHEIAAVIFEPIQGEGGVVPIATETLVAWRHAATNSGTFFIADEIQCGFGRCGATSIAVSDSLTPDAVLLGKPLGGGVMPCSALVASEALWQPLDADPFIHSSTFAGHPLSAAAAIAACQELDEAFDTINTVSRRVERILRRLAAEYPKLITDVRGRGLLWGLATADPVTGGSLLTNLCQEGLLVSPCLGEPTVIRLLPPMCLTDGDLDRAERLLTRALDRTADDLSVAQPTYTERTQ